MLTGCNRRSCAQIGTCTSWLDRTCRAPSTPSLHRHCSSTSTRCRRTHRKCRRRACHWARRSSRRTMNCRRRRRCRHRFSFRCLGRYRTCANAASISSMNRDQSLEPRSVGLKRRRRQKAGAFAYPTQVVLSPPHTPQASLTCLLLGLPSQPRQVLFVPAHTPHASKMSPFALHFCPLRTSHELAAAALFVP